MKEITLDVPNYLIEELNYKIRVINARNAGEEVLSANDIAREALAVYKWAIDNIYEGYAIVAADSDKNLITQIATPNMPAKAPTKKG